MFSIAGTEKHGYRLPSPQLFAEQCRLDVRMSVGKRGRENARTVSVGPRVAEAARRIKPTLRPGAKRTPRWTRRHVLRIDRR